MPRGLSTEIQAAIAADVVRPVFLAFFDFDGGAIRTWTGQGDLSYDGETWPGNGVVIDWPVITESLDLIADNASFTLSGNFGYAVDIADPANYRARACEVYIGFLEEDGSLPSTNVRKLFSGRMAVVGFDEDAVEDGYSLTAESRLVDLQKAKTWRYTHQAQLQRFPGDMGLEYAGLAQDSLFLSRGETPDKPFSRKIVYGTTVVDGSVVFIATSGSGSRYLNLVVAFADHNCDALEQLYLDDRAVLDGAGSVSGEFVNVVTYQKRLGGDNQTVVVALQNEVGTTVWTDDHRLRGITYVYLRILYSEELFGDAAPRVSARLRGKPLYDPRSQTTAYSENAALVVRDYLLSERYGFSGGSAEVDDAAFSVAANDCDLLMAKADASTEKRYTINGWLDTAATIGENLKTLLAGMAGQLSYVGGVFAVYAGNYALTSISIADADLLDDIQFSNRNLREAYNGARGLYRTPDLDWQEEDYPVYQDAIAQAADGEDRWIDLPLPHTTSAARCQRIAKIAVQRSRATRTVGLGVQLRHLNARAGDVISLNTSKSNIGALVYEIRSIRIVLGELPRLTMDLLEVSASDYAWNAATEETELTVPEEPADSILAWTLARLASPSATPGSKTFTVGFNVTVAHNEAGVTCYYTTDGSEPDEADNSIADGGTIAISTADTTLKLKSFQNGGSLTSEVVTYQYTYDPPTNLVADPLYYFVRGESSVSLYFISAVDNTTMYTSTNGGSSYTTHNDADDDEPKFIASLNQNWTPSDYRAYCSKAGYLDSNQVVVANKCIPIYSKKEWVASAGRWKLNVKVYGTNATLWMRERAGSLGSWSAWTSGTGYNWGDSPGSTIWLTATSGPDPDYEFYVAQSGWENSDILFVDQFTNS